MTVVNVTKKWSGRPGEKATDRRVLSDGYEVLTDSVTDDQNVVLGAPGLPALNTGFPTDGFATLRRLIPRPIGPLFWEVEAVYETEPLSGINPDPNPLNAPPEILWTTTKALEPIDRALNAANQAVVPIINSSRQMFDPPVSADLSDPVLIVTRNKADINVGQLLGYVDSVNSDFFFAEPGQARIISIEAPLIYYTPFNYYRITYQIQFRRGIDAVPNGPGGALTGGPAKAWHKRIADMGTVEWKTVPGFPVALPWAIMTGGVVAGAPVPLDGDGKRNTTGNLVWLEFKVYRTANFSALGIL
jgi:hypothetical protein